MRTQLRICTVLASALAVLVFCPTLATCGPRDHDDGFFLRLSAGAGPVSTSAESMGLDWEMSGSGGDVNLAIGGIVMPNLALHGTIFGWLMSEPDADFGPLGSGVLDGDVSLNVVGGGITYYFMPINIYVSGSAGAATLSYDGPSGSGETDYGYAADVTVGKEWWVSDGWALGVAGGFSYHSIPDEDMDSDWTGTSVAVRFTATHN